MDAEKERLRQAYEVEVRRLRDLADRRQRELEVLGRVVERIHAEEDAERVMEIALEEIVTRLDLSAAWILLGDTQDQRLRLAASRGLAASYLQSVRLHGLDECLCPEVFWSGHRLQARNTLQCPRMPDLIEGMRTPTPHACVPLAIEGGSRGVLNVAARSGAVFSDEALRFLETLGHQICLALDRARHIGTERRRDREARGMAAVSRAVGGSLEVEQVLEAVGAAALEIIAADRVAILLGSDARHLRVAFVGGQQHPELRVGQSLDLAARGSKVLRQAIEQGVAFRIDDSSTDERVGHELARAWDTHAALILPLTVRERSFGVLSLTRTQARGWTDEQFELAEALGAQAAVALDNARLYEEARRSLEQLRDAQRRIIESEKMAMLGTFASGLAHEVRNPLNSITLQLSLLERRLAAVEPSIAERQRQVVAIIREEIRRLDALVGEFLLFSRTSRLQFQPTDLDLLIEDVLRLLQPEGEAAGVTLHHERAQPAIPSVPADGEKIKQVIINLVRNAMEAMPDGGDVYIRANGSTRWAELAVRDTGPGLPEGLDVFQLFVSTKAQGTGLGLSIAQQIVNAHGGELLADSQPGLGATFTARLPLGPVQEAEAAPA
jgi:signal transduction histidine kinase